MKQRRSPARSKPPSSNARRARNRSGAHKDGGESTARIPESGRPWLYGAFAPRYFPLGDYMASKRDVAWQLKRAELQDLVRRFDVEVRGDARILDDLVDAV